MWYFYLFFYLYFYLPPSHQWHWCLTLNWDLLTNHLDRNQKNLNLMPIFIFSPIKTYVCWSSRLSRLMLTFQIIGGCIVYDGEKNHDKNSVHALYQMCYESEAWLYWSPDTMFISHYMTSSESRFRDSSIREPCYTLYTALQTMSSERHCLNWNDCQENILPGFKELRKDKAPWSPWTPHINVGVWRLRRKMTLNSKFWKYHPSNTEAFSTLLSFVFQGQRCLRRHMPEHKK